MARRREAFSAAPASALTPDDKSKFIRWLVQTDPVLPFKTIVKRCREDEAFRRFIPLRKVKGERNEIPTKSPKWVREDISEQQAGEKDRNNKEKSQELEKHGDLSHAESPTEISSEDGSGNTTRTERLVEDNETARKRKRHANYRASKKERKLNEKQLGHRRNFS
ncbi:hypothetical protein NHQ30_005361 [Ciborinia camelliae]|nr:hypothetical protein NHQ30_005361 [Ciborinia camelliae]